MGQSSSSGEILFNDGKLEAALNQFEKDYTSTSKSSLKLKSAIQIGCLFQLENDFIKAHEYFDIALSIQPNHGLAILHKSILVFLYSTKDDVIEFTKFLEEKVLSNVSKEHLNHLGVALCIHVMTIAIHALYELASKQTDYLILASELLTDADHPILNFVKRVADSGFNMTEDVYKDSCDYHSNYYKIWNDRGKSLFLVHTFKQSLACFSICIALNPSSHNAWLDAALVLIEVKKYYDALKILRCITDLISKKNNNAWFHRGHCCLELKLNSEAVNCFDFLIQLDPSQSYYWERKSYALLQLDPINLCKDALICAKNSLKLSPSNINAILQKGKSHFHLKQFDKALSSLELYLQKRPGDIDVILFKVEVLKEMGKFDLAKSILEDIMERTVQMKKIWFSYSECLLHMEKFEEGIEATEQVFRLPDKYNVNDVMQDSNCYIIPRIVNFVYEKISDKYNNDNIFIYDEIEEDKEITHKTWVVRSLLLWKSFNLDDALLAIDQALKLNPYSAKEWEIKGNILSHYEDRSEESLQAFITASEYDNKNPLILKNIISILSISKKYNEALEYSKKLLSLTTSDYHTIYSHCHILYCLKRYEELIEFLNQNTVHSDVEVLLLLAKSYHQLKDFDNELELLNKIVELYPDNVDILYQLGLCHLARKDFETSLIYINRLMESKEKRYKSKALLSLYKIIKGDELDLESLMKKHKKWNSWKKSLNEDELNLLYHHFRNNDIK